MTSYCGRSRANYVINSNCEKCDDRGQMMLQTTQTRLIDHRYPVTANTRSHVHFNTFGAKNLYRYILHEKDYQFCGC